MKKIISSLFVLMVVASSFTVSQEPQTEVMTKDKGVYVINTTSLCKVKGFQGTTPLLVTIKNDKIVKVEALPNTETPQFFEKIKQLMLPKYAEQKFEDYQKVDAVTGATRSSIAVRAHMKEAYEYYKKNK